MTSGLLTTPYINNQHSIGFEEISRAARHMLITNLDDGLAEQEAKWATADLQEQAEWGATVGQVELERFDPSHIFAGPHRSMIEAPPELFPNISIMAYVAKADADDFDQLDTSMITMFVETMVITGPIGESAQDLLDHETIVHRRIQRTTEAVCDVFKRDPMLMGTVRPFQRPPNGGIGESSWVRREDKGKGPRFLWQGSRLQYTLQRDSKP